MREAGAALRQLEDISVRDGVPLAGLTTWRTGGPARYLLEVRTSRGLLDALRVLGETGVAVLVLGNGSNVLVSDTGFDGAVIRLEGSLAEVELDGDLLTAGAGAPLAAAAARASSAVMSGLEFATGIPGTAGGAVMTNAGTFAGSTATSLAAVEAVTLDGEAVSFDSFEDAYRMPLIGEGLIVTTTKFRLRPGDADSIKCRMREVRERRQGSQPVGVATAGSVFKNPPEEPAGRLLDSCGMKGASVGRASVSSVHANFIVNEGGASASDIKSLMDLVAGEVDARFGIRLVPEVRLIGFTEES